MSIKFDSKVQLLLSFNSLSYYFLPVLEEFLCQHEVSQECLGVLLAAPLRHRRLVSGVDDLHLQSQQRQNDVWTRCTGKG